MLELEFFNSLTKIKERFIPIDTNHIKCYVCGPTVYDVPHIGNLRSAVVYDLLYRVLCLSYPKVSYVRNVTDVDDKIVNIAQSLNITSSELSGRVYDDFQSNLQKLNCLPPTAEPKATENIDVVIELIQALIKRGYAYENKGHVFFSINKYPEYGALSGKKLEDLLVDYARIESNDLKSNNGDFILWKPAIEADYLVESFFASPWGEGRPGWHIECSAMSYKYLGCDFDIHGGGVDLKFPHHENEIAQSVNAHSGAKHAKYWIHNGFLMVEGKKMSKSLGNFLRLEDLESRGYHPLAFRYLSLLTHYRKPLNFTDHNIQTAHKKILELHELLSLISEEDFLAYSTYSNEEIINSMGKKPIAYIENDMNFPQLIAYLNQLIKEYRADNNHKILMQSLSISLFCGLVNEELLGGLRQKKSSNTKGEEHISDEVKDIIHRLKLARKEKNYQESDFLRDYLIKMGYKVTFSHDGEIVLMKS